MFPPQVLLKLSIRSWEGGILGRPLLLMDMLTPPRGKQHWFCPTITSNLLPASAQWAPLWLITPTYSTDARLFLFSSMCLTLSDRLCQYWNVTGLSHPTTSSPLMWSIGPATTAPVQSIFIYFWHFIPWAIKWKTGHQVDLWAGSIPELTGNVNDRNCTCQYYQRAHGLNNAHVIVRSEVLALMC